jgi:hypothetical protein
VVYTGESPVQRKDVLHCQAAVHSRIGPFVKQGPYSIIAGPIAIKRDR